LNQIDEIMKIQQKVAKMESIREIHKNRKEKSNQVTALNVFLCLKFMYVDFFDFFFNLILGYVFKSKAIRQEPL
jgi:hypothetical protein